MVNGMDWRQPASMRGLLYLLATALVVAGGMAEPASAEGQSEFSSRVQIVSRPELVPDFTLIDQDAKAVRLSDLRGSTLLFFFGFTNCQSVCPPTMQKLRYVTRTLSKESPGLTTVLISVDGERDTPEVLKAYLDPFLPGFVGLTGDPLVIRGIAATFSAVFFKGMPRSRAGDYDVEHTSQVYVVDGEGRLRMSFYNATVDEMTAAIRQVMTKDPGNVTAATRPDA